MGIEHKWTGFNGYEFDLSSSGPGEVSLTTEGVEGMGFPRLSSFTQSAALLDGQRVTGWRAQPREVFWPLQFDGHLLNGFALESWFVLQERFWSTMRPNRFGLWRVTVNGSWRELRCRFESDGTGVYNVDPSLTGIEVHGVSLVADDPFWRGETVSVTVQTAEDVRPFFEPGPTHVLNIMSANTAATAELSNPGDVPAWPVIRVDGPATAFSAAGVSAAIIVEPGEWLVVDTDPEVQTAVLHHVDGWQENVTARLQTAQFTPVMAGNWFAFDATVEGAGSMSISIVPRYFRAF